MSSPWIVPIVEGHGELEALPLLLRRIVSECDAESVPSVNPPIRIKAGSFLRDEDYFARFISLAAAKAAKREGTVLILLDCEDDCPAELGPRLLAKARAIRSDGPIWSHSLIASSRPGSSRRRSRCGAAAGFRPISKRPRIPRPSVVPRSGSAKEWRSLTTRSPTR